MSISSSQMKTFHAWRIHKVTQGTEARFDKRSLDELTPGDVVVRIAYSSINCKDALAVTGQGTIVRGHPRTAGVNLSGVVESSQDPAFSPGDIVLVTGANIGEGLDGSLSEFARLPALAVVPLPKTLSLFAAKAGHWRRPCGAEPWITLTVGRSVTSPALCGLEETSPASDWWRPLPSKPLSCRTFFAE